MQHTFFLLLLLFKISASSKNATGLQERCDCSAPLDPDWDYFECNSVCPESFKKFCSSKCQKLDDILHYISLCHYCDKDMICSTYCNSASNFVKHKEICISNAYCAPSEEICDFWCIEEYSSGYCFNCLPWLGEQCNRQCFKIEHHLNRPFCQEWCNSNEFFQKACEKNCTKIESFNRNYNFCSKNCYNFPPEACKEKCSIFASLTSNLEYCYQGCRTDITLHCKDKCNSIENSLKYNFFCVKGCPDSDEALCNSFCSDYKNFTINHKFCSKRCAPVAIEVCDKTCNSTSNTLMAYDFCRRGCPSYLYNLCSRNCFYVVPVKADYEFCENCYLATPPTSICSEGSISTNTDIGGTALKSILGAG